MKEWLRSIVGRGMWRHLLAEFARYRDQQSQLRSFRSERDAFIKAGGTRRFSIGDDFPCLSDRRQQIPFEPHYFYHPAWACRVLRTIAPRRHVDISSIFSFVGCISAFWETEYYEYQPPVVRLDNLSAGRVDLLQLPFDDGSLESLSCMHVIEHVGLGRYGDPLEPDGDLRAASELARVLAPGGNLLFVTPMAEQNRIEFNAHRIYSYAGVLALFPTLKVREFSFIPDDHQRGLIRHASPLELKGQKFACGCFHLQRSVLP
jgi:SAM-dependent methyltransferase